jgi:transposase
LKGYGFSLQKPAVRAAQRDEDAIGTWRERRFAELKKRP